MQFKVINTEILPLRQKHYSTDLIVTVGIEGDQYEMGVSISGYAPNPSIREIKAGWEPDFGMDHVESEAHWRIAEVIHKALTGEKHE